MNNTMINAVGFPAKEYDDEVTGKGVILAEVMIAVKDKEVAQGMLELFRLGVERSDDMKKIEAVFYRLMRGSHTYDSREMSELIKGTIQEAEDLGIETLTPRELEQMLGKWKPRKEEEK